LRSLRTGKNLPHPSQAGGGDGLRIDDILHPQLRRHIACIAHLLERGREWREVDRSGPGRQVRIRLAIVVVQIDVTQQWA